MKQITDNEIYLLIKYIKSVLCRVAKGLSNIEACNGIALPLPLPLPFTFYLLPFTFYLLPFTFYLLPFTFYLYLYLIRLKLRLC